MKISIVIPAYNAEDTIRAAVDSALNQVFPKDDFEIVVVNDGSNDRTLEILKTYGDKIRLINQERNLGFIKTANAGLSAAEGEYVIKLDSDDYFEPDILLEMCAVLGKNADIDFLYCDYFEKSVSGDTKMVRTDENIFNTIGVGVMYRRSSFAKEKFFSENTGFPEYDLILKTQERWKFYHIDKPLFCYNRRAESITGDKGWVAQALDRLRERYPNKESQLKMIRQY